MLLLGQLHITELVWLSWYLVVWFLQIDLLGIKFARDVSISQDVVCAKPKKIRGASGEANQRAQLFGWLSLTRRTLSIAPKSLSGIIFVLKKTAFLAS